MQDVFRSADYPYIKQQPGIVQIVIEALRRYLPPRADLLSLGAGRGYVEELIEDRLRRKIVRLDLNESALSEARPGSVSICGSVYHLPVGSDRFDSVLAVDLIEHLTEPRLAMEEIRRILRKEGFLFIKAPNWGHWHYRWWYLRQGSLKTFHQLRQGHFVFYNYQEMEQLVAAHGFQVVQRWSFCYTPERIARLRPNLFSASIILMCQRR